MKINIFEWYKFLDLEVMMYMTDELADWRIGRGENW